MEVTAATCLGWLCRRWKNDTITPAIQEFPSLEFCIEEFSWFLGCEIIRGIGPLLRAQPF